MRFSTLSLATAALAASAGVAGATEFPSFHCGSPGGAIVWSSAVAGQPIAFDPVSGTSGPVGCSGSDLVEVIPRKAGRPQQETIITPIAFVDDGGPVDAVLTFDLKMTQKQVDLPNAVRVFESYLDIREFAAYGFGVPPFADLFLGLKITTLKPFEGDLGLKWDNKGQVLSMLIPLQDDEATLRFVTAPGAAPEPETWAVLTTGLVGVGALMRRRRARAW